VPVFPPVPDPYASLTAAADDDDDDDDEKAGDDDKETEGDE
jgi:hypothetical protein